MANPACKSSSGSMAKCLQQIEEVEKVLAAVRRTLKDTCPELAANGSKASVVPNLVSQASPKILDQVLTDAMQGSDSPPPRKSPSGMFDAFSSKSSCETIWVPVCCNFLRVPIFHPDSPKMLVWSLIGFSCILYLCFALPFFICFDASPGGISFAIASFIDAYFICDVILNFFIAYRDTDGEMVTSPSKIFRGYATHWLFPDIIASIPWDWISVGSKYGEMSKGIRLLRVARIAKLSALLKVATDGALKEKLDIIIESSPQLVFLAGVLRILMMLSFIMHWAACFWYVVGMMNPHGQSWVKQHLHPDAGTWERYVYSLYFTLTTMTTVGYGDIVAQNYTEVSFVIILLFVASFVFAGLMGAFTDLITTLNSDRNALAERRRQLGQYMNWRNVPHSLFMQVRRHLLFLWTAHAGYDGYEEEIKEQLPPKLRRELCFHIYGAFLNELPFLTWMHGYKACLMDLAYKLTSSFLSNGDYLFRVSEPNVNMYILVNGTVRLSLNEDMCSHADTMEEEEVRPQAAFLDNMLRGLARATTMPSLEAEQLGSSQTRNFGSQQGCLVHAESTIQIAQTKVEFQALISSHAAKLIQKQWRQAIKTKKLQHARSPSAKSSPILQTKMVSAPSFFGEACLWEPFETWDTSPPPMFRYAARCATRCELVIIKRSVLQEVIELYSPWLRDRFEYFRKAIIEQGSSTTAGEGNSNDGADHDEQMRLPSEQGPFESLLLQISSLSAPLLG